MKKIQLKRFLVEEIRPEIAAAALLIVLILHLCGVNMSALKERAYRRAEAR